MSENRTKFPIKTSLELTEEQAAFVAAVAAHLTRLRGKRISKKAAHRLMVDHCQTCDIFLTSISMERNGSTGEQS